MRWLAHLATAALAFAATCIQGTATAQGATKDKQPKWKIDPYTKGDPELIKKAGYVSLGPFDFGGRGSSIAKTTDIEQSLPYNQIRWIETAHFRIGTELPEWTVPVDAPTRAKLRAELERLAQKLPGIDPKTRRIDPWLRGHLFAQRCEDVYAEFSAMAGVKDEDFPQDPKNVVKQPGSVYMGYGPYLGMKDKYLVLLFDSMTPFMTYMKQYLGRESKFGQRWHFRDVGSLIYTVSTECDGGRFKHDTALHCSIGFNVSQCLLDGFRYYNYDLPVWIREGLAHWYERRIDEKWNSFDQTEGSPADQRTTWKWKPYMKGMVDSGKYRTFSECFAWRDFGDIKFEDHVAIWSRMDYLLSQDHAKWKTFLFAVKGRVKPEDWSPNTDDLVGAARDALQQAYGISILQLDEKWGEWVKATYPSQ